MSSLLSLALNYSADSLINNNNLHIISYISDTVLGSLACVSASYEVGTIIKPVIDEETDTERSSDFSRVSQQQVL